MSSPLPLLVHDHVALFGLGVPTLISQAKQERDGLVACKIAFDSDVANLERTIKEMERKYNLTLGQHDAFVISCRKPILALLTMVRPKKLTNAAEARKVSAKKGGKKKVEKDEMNKSESEKIRDLEQRYNAEKLKREIMEEQNQKLRQCVKKMTGGKADLGEFALTEKKWDETMRHKRVDCKKKNTRGQHALVLEKYGGQKDELQWKMQAAEKTEETKKRRLDKFLEVESRTLEQESTGQPLTSQQSAQLRTAEKQINQTRIELLAATDRKLEAKEILDKIETAEALTGKKIRTGGNKRVKR